MITNLNSSSPSPRTTDIIGNQTLPDGYVPLTDVANFYTSITTPSSIGTQSNLNNIYVNGTTSVIGQAHLPEISELRNRLDSLSVDTSILREQVNMWQKIAEDLAAVVSDMVLLVHGTQVSECIEKLANRARIREGERKIAKKRMEPKLINPQELHEDIASEIGIGVRELQIDKTQ